jgi:hypothetical protein
MKLGKSTMLRGRGTPFAHGEGWCFVRRMRTMSVTLLGVLAIAAVIGAAAASSRPSRVRLAKEHAVKVAAKTKKKAVAHGNVIVWLKQTNSNVSLAHGLARRAEVDRAQQAPLVKSIKSAGGRGVHGLTLINAVAAHVTAKEAKRLEARGDVSKVVPDSVFTQTNVVSTPTVSASDVAKPNNVDPDSQQECNGAGNPPLLEPEALQTMHYEGASSDNADTIADGTGVTVASEDLDELAYQANFQRPDGQHVVIDAPAADYTGPVRDDPNLDEWFGDASAIAAQGTVVYQYGTELPFSGLPTDGSCSFVIQGDAPGANLIDLDQVDPGATISTQDGITTATTKTPTSDIIEGMQNAITNGADVFSESYGSGNGSTGLWAANNAAIATGITVVASAGDEGADNTFIASADDPEVIGAGASTNMRLLAQGYGYSQWESNQITTLSSTGVGQPFSEPTAPGKVPDLVAPGYGGQAACDPTLPEACPTNANTESFGGTSQSAPFIAGAAADVIEAYRNSHDGASPTPAMVKQILTSTATDIDAPAGEQGAGEVNIYAAVNAAEDEPGSTVTNAAPTLSSDTTQLDVSGDENTSAKTTFSVFNGSSSPTTVTPTFRTLGPATSITPSTESEPVSAPNPALPVPAQGANAAQPVTFTVAPGTGHININMIWSDPTNSNILYYIVTDPSGALTQISYDYGTGTTSQAPGAYGTVPNIQHTEINDPDPGTWTIQPLWGNGRAHLQSPPNVPGTFTGNVQFQVTAQNYQTTSAGSPVKIAANVSKNMTVKVPLNSTPGDNTDTSVQLTGSNGTLDSLPVLERTFIPSTGGNFQAVMGDTVGRNQGSPNSLFYINVGKHEPAMNVSINTADGAPDNKFEYELYNPSGKEVAADVTPTTTQQAPDPTTGVADANLTVPDPVAGRWEIVIIMDTVTTSGNEFSQTFNGNVSFDNGVSVLSGLPNGGKLTAGSTNTVNLEVTNVLRVGRTYTFSSTAGDIAPVSTYVSPGQEVVVPLTLTPTATKGTVSGTLNVSVNTSYPVPTRGTTTLTSQTIASFPYKYKIVKPAK